jgi:hypothetical protein
MIMKGICSAVICATKNSFTTLSDTFRKLLCRTSGRDMRSWRQLARRAFGLGSLLETPITFTIYHNLSSVLPQ